MSINTGRRLSWDNTTALLTALYCVLKPFIGCKVAYMHVNIAEAQKILTPLLRDKSTKAGLLLSRTPFITFYQLYFSIGFRNTIFGSCLIRYGMLRLDSCCCVIYLSGVFFGVFYQVTSSKSQLWLYRKLYIRSTCGRWRDV